MSGVGGIGSPMGVDRVMALRAQILEQNAALQRASQAAGTTGGVGQTAAPNRATGTASAAGNSFTTAFEQVLNNVNNQQASASQLSEAYERGDTVDIAKVMLARQQASVSFEATLQVRNKLLSAYKDIMSMPV